MMKKSIFAVIISVCANLIILGFEMALRLEVSFPARLLIVCPTVVVLTILTEKLWR